MSPNTVKRRLCCHSLHDLQTEMEPHWCNPNDKKIGLFTYNWMLRAKGCVGCNKMYVLKPRKDGKLGKLDDSNRGLYDDLESGVLGKKHEQKEKAKNGKGGISKALDMSAE